MSAIEDRLKELGIVLPRPPKPVANYLPGVKVGEILYVAGTVGTAVDENDNDYLPIKGQLGAELSIEQGYQSARLVAINHLAMIKAVIGDLDRVVRIVKMVGYINAAPDFKDAPAVLNPKARTSGIARRQPVRTGIAGAAAGTVVASVGVSGAFRLSSISIAMSAASRKRRFASFCKQRRKRVRMLAGVVSGSAVQSGSL